MERGNNSLRSRLKGHFSGRIRTLDSLVLFAVLFLFGLSVIMIYSITGTGEIRALRNWENPTVFLRSTLENGIVGLFGMFFIYFLPTGLIRKLGGPVFLSLNLILLMATSLFGVGTSASPGVRRWIEIDGLGRFQPSEFIRLGIILSTAWLITLLMEKRLYYIKPLKVLKSKRRNGFQKALRFICSYWGILLYILLCGFWIVSQRDLGSAFIILGMGGSMFLCSGIPWKQLFALLSVPAAGVAAFLMLFVQGYQIDRFQAWQDPFTHDLGWQLRGSFISIALGGWTGEGLQRSIRLGTLPEAHTDMIIAIIAEELGVLMVLWIMILYGLIIFRCFQAALKSRDLFTSLVCIGTGAFFFFQPMVNLGGASGFIPLSGVTLPLLSFGGTSKIAVFAIIGLYLNFRSTMLLENREKRFISQPETASPEKIIPFKQFG